MLVAIVSHRRIGTGYSPAELIFVQAHRLRDSSERIVRADYPGSSARLIGGQSQCPGSLTGLTNQTEHFRLGKNAHRPGSYTRLTLRAHRRPVSMPRLVGQAQHPVPPWAHRLGGRSWLVLVSHGPGSFS